LQIANRLVAAARPGILEGVDELLAGHGFHRTFFDKRVADRRLFEWRRALGVIEHVVDARYRPRLKGDFEIGVGAHLRLRPGRDIALDGTSVHYLNGRLLMFEFPMHRALFIRSAERLREIVVKDTARALDWFAGYSTPSLCLARLDSPDRNGVGLGTKPHTEAKRLLESLAPLSIES
jgi:hypothetical protein